MAEERTRTFVGVLPDNPAYDAWQQAHDSICEAREHNWQQCHNPYTGREQRVLLHVFETVRDQDLNEYVEGVGEQTYGVAEITEIVKIEVALREGEEGRFARWGRPATLTEET